MLCQARSPSDAAYVQVLLDEEMVQCHAEGIDVELRLNLSPIATAMVQNFYRKNEELRRYQTAFFALQIAGGHVGHGILLLFALFSRKVNRDPLFFNFTITTIFSSVVFAFLLYHGTEGHTVINPLGIVSSDTCLAQAAYANGAQVMTAGSTMALIIQLWIGLHAVTLGDPPGPKQTRCTTTVLMVIPYILFLCFSLPSLFHVSPEGTYIERALPSHFYCMVIVGTKLHPFVQALYGVTLGILIITLGFDVLIIKILYRHWWAFRHVPTKLPVPISILLRVMSFSLYRVAVAVAYAIVVYNPPVMLVDPVLGSNSYINFGVPDWVDLLQAAIPVVAFIVLGVNSDMATTFMFWRKTPRIEYAACEQQVT